MNIVITLPTLLELAFEQGIKTKELRSKYPRHLKVGEEGFFIVQKGLQGSSCWCRISNIDTIHCTDEFPLEQLKYLCVDLEWLIDYLSNKNKVYLWHVDKVIRFERPLSFDELGIDRAPQAFVYTPLSSGESF